MSMIDRVRDYIEDHDLLRRSVTVPLKFLVLAGVATVIVMIAIVASAKVQRHVGVTPPASAADVAALRASVEALRTEIKVCLPKPAVKR